MTIDRYEYNVIEVGEPRTVGKPSLRETSEFPTFANRLGTSTGVLARHTLVALGITTGATLLLTYAVYLILQGAVSAMLSLFTGDDYAVSLDGFKIALENFVACLQENFSMKS